jgi:pimeloyl-ACP methyl ester carboxylesterase
MKRRGARFFALLIAGLLMVPGSYWAYRGVTVFRAELSEYEEIPDLDIQARATLAAATEEVTWSLADGSRQRAFYLPPRNGAVVVYAHGTLGDASSLLPEALAMARYGFGALLLDLPGYGASQGRRDWGPSFQATLREAVDFAIRQPGVEPGRIGGFGYSWGTYVIARAAAEDHRIAALVLLAASSSVTDAMHGVFLPSRLPALHHFANAAATWYGVPVREMDMRALLPRLGNRPVQIVVGERDRRVSRAALDELRRLSANSRVWVIEGVGHVGIAKQVGEPYFLRLREFWQGALAGNSEARTR